MDFFSIWHWLIVGVIGLLLFGGRGKISETMGDFGKGIKAFKKGLTDGAEDSPAADAPIATIDEAPLHESSRPLDAQKSAAQTSEAEKRDAQHRDAEKPEAEKLSAD